MKVLAQNVSASAAERNWSVYGQIVTPARSCMQHKRADKLVYCHEALHMRSASPVGAVCASRHGESARVRLRSDWSRVQFSLHFTLVLAEAGRSRRLSPGEAACLRL